MTPTELMQAANDARPDLLEKVAAALYILDRTSPEFAAEVKADLAEITGVVLQKVAAAPDMAAFGYAVGGSILSGIGLATASDMYDAAKRGLTKGRNFKAILRANPDLTQRVDKKTLQKSFNTLHMYAPEFTADPNLGGQLLAAMSEVPENQVGVIKDMITARKNYRDAQRRTFAPGPGIDMARPVRSAADETNILKLQETSAANNHRRDVSTKILKYNLERLKKDGSRESFP